MCGIFAYKGSKEATNYLIDGLKYLEYRGYDSAGLCMIDNEGNFFLQKAIGGISNLAEKVDNSIEDLSGFNLGIAHTRWATHGKVTEQNTHPHYSSNKRFFIVHNGIIENYIQLREKLEKKYKFYSTTDSEVIAKLIEDLYDKDMVSTLKKLKNTLVGAYALAIIDTQNPDQLVGIKQGTPLVVGFNDNNEFFIASDIHAISSFASKCINLDDGESVIIKGNLYKVYDKDFNLVEKKIKCINKKDLDIQLGKFKHYMEKEIFQSVDVVRGLLSKRVDFENQKILSNSLQQIRKYKIKNIEIIASGTSYHAGLIGANWFEELANIPTRVFISAEYKYKKIFVNKNTLYIFISQSGETADTLECLKKVKKEKGLTFGIVNVVESSISRLSDMGLYTYSGTEIGVAATKTFIGQVVVLFLMAINFGQNNKSLQKIQVEELLKGLKQVPEDLNKVLSQAETIRQIAEKYSVYKNMFFLGRNLLYPVAMEGSLKCKEITYLHTESYSAGELKHGPLSLIDENFPVILINPLGKLYEKNISTLKEIKARHGKVLGIVTENDPNKSLYDDYIQVPANIEEMYVFSTSVVLQLFAYFIARKLGREIDKPRNLAKSVTVE